MTVSELARRAGVTADTVRHYTRRGLLAPVRAAGNGYKHYNQADLARLLFIRKARLLGFSLNDVRNILEESSHEHSPCPLVREIMVQRLQENRRRLQDLERLQSRMERATAQWADLPDGVPDAETVCHLIEKIGIDD